MNGHFKKWWKGLNIIAAFWVMLFIGLLLAVTGNGWLYGKNSGLKYSRNYTPDDYKLQHQNWGILQDHRGVIYTANGGGVLEYDGVSWNNLKIPKTSTYSLAIDSSGTIYVGGINELGFLAPNFKGQMEYISLLEYVVDEARDFGKVWKIHTTEEGIYCRTQKYLFLWNPQLKQMKSWQPKEGQKYVFNASFTCGGKYFIKQTNVGLMQMEKDSLKIVPGGETFASIRTMFLLAPYDSIGKKLLIGTREKGFFIYDGTMVRSFPTEVDEYIKEKKASYGIALSRSPGDIVIATLRGGVVVIDFQGCLKYLFTKSSGLLDNNVKYVFEDSQGNLWAALNKGIAKIEYLSPLSIYDDRSQLPGMVYTMIRHSGVLYAGTSQGLFYLALDSNKFSPIPSVSSACWSFLSIGDSLLAAASTGVYQLKNSTIRKITGTPSYVLLQSRHVPNRIWVGMRSGLASIYQDPKQGNHEWIEEYRCENIVQEIRTIVEDRKGNLWLGARAAGVIKVVLTGNRTIENCNIIRYDTSRQLPDGTVQVGWAAGHVMFGTKKGLLRFDETKDMFVMDNTLGKTFVRELKDVYRVVEDRNKSIWLHDKGQNYQAVPKPDGTYEIRKKPLARIPIGWQVNTIYPDPRQNVTWFGTHEGLIRFEAGVKKNYNHEYRTIIRRISINGTPRFYNYTSPSKRSSTHVPVFTYNDRNFRFDFAAPFFEDEAGIRYRYFLEGYDKEWSQWNKEAYKDYTNLDSRVYTFRVKARNVYHNESREAAFKFKILPPWYGTWWAYLLYVMVLFLVIFLTVWWRSWKLQLEKQKLEQVIKERTKEINRKNQQLEKQTLLLKEQAEKLTELDHAKSRFFANISHEFRTPLTLITGPLEHILSSPMPTGIREKLNLMHRNSHRLLKLINRLLDLSRIDSGKMKLQTAPQDIVSFLKGIFASFEHSAREKKLDLEFRTHEEPIVLYFDAEKMEDVFANLLSNAVKFTPSGGKVTVSIRCLMEKEEDFPSGSLEISVRDTGVGIPLEQLSHIFDRFYQVDSHKRKSKGSGIGLALTRELVALHHGKIDVNSRVGENSGTDFILRFPLGKGHLKPDEIVDSSEKGIISRRGKQGEEVENGFEELAADEIWMKEKDLKAEPPDTVKETKKQTVLVIEDNPDMRQFIRESIEPHYSVIEAQDGKDGIEKARTIMPDLIVSDIMMPEVDGYQLCETLKKDFKTSHTPIILLTAKASESSVVQGLETGADDYITKPFNTKILLSRIKNLIDLRRQIQEKIQRQMLLQPEEIKVSSLDQRFLKKLQDIIEKNLSDPDLNVEALSEKMDITRVTLNKKIQALTGETANEFIRSYRLKRAVQLLKQNFGSVTEVAFEVGFSNHSYFTKCFREKFHQLPSALAAEDTGRPAAAAK